MYPFSGKALMPRTLAIQVPPDDAKAYEMATPEQQRQVDAALRGRLRELMKALAPAPQAPTPSQGAENPALQPPRRHKEKAWRRAHETELESYAGQWVVLEGEMIVAHGTKPAEVLECAKSKGVRIPYIFYVEKLEPDVAIMGL